MKIGIAGFGFVGQAVYGSIKDTRDVIIYDKYKKSNKLEELKGCAFVFVCFPTPSIEGKQDTTALNQFFDDMVDFKGIFIVKSTVVYSFYKEWIKEYRIVYNPEFLKQNDAINDFRNQQAMVIGGECNDARAVEDLYRKKFMLDKLKEARIVTLKEAVDLKYIHNIYHAYKSLFWNYVYDVTGNHRKMFDLYWLISEFRNEMSGICADGKRGFGGACFPKDLIAYNAENHHILTDFMAELNTQYRPEEMEDKIWRTRYEIQ